MAEPALFRWAVAHLPTLFPKLRRLVWLHTDTLVQADLLALWQLPMDGKPLAAVSDCTLAVESYVNVSLISSFTAQNEVPRGCSFDMGVLMFDLVQWNTLDISSRVEYWIRLYSRMPPLMGQLYEDALDPRIPFNLALHDAYLPLDRRWNLFSLNRRAYSHHELQIWSEAWNKSSVADPFRGSLQPVRALEEPGEGRILHFSGSSEPWESNEQRVTPRASSQCMANGVLARCEELWQSYAGYPQKEVVDGGWRSRQQVAHR